MPTIAGIKDKLRREKERLRRDFNVGAIGVFGSCARGEAGQDSDIDILVEFAAPIGLFRFMELEDHLGELLGVKVDLVSKKALKPAIGRQILTEIVQI
ncbi:MAG: nucleotidyltransferase [Desulfarculus sp.]|jgi:predicted nucleotidyltransferase|nr:MAG: nucleotidyltransferase [Desulfarculus sp.]